MKVQEEVIEIPDDEQLTEDKLNLVETGNTSFDVQWTICKEEALNQQNGEKVLLNRLIKFFFYDKKIEPGKQHFFPRKQPNILESMINTQLVIFGCDFAKIKDLRKVYGATRSKTINASNVILIFEQPGDPLNALKSHALSPEQLVIKQEEDIQQKPSSGTCPGWYQMKPYVFLNQNVRLYARFATPSDSLIRNELEEKTKIYKQSCDIYNLQQEMNKTSLKREKLDIQKQRATDNLYNQYASANAEFKTGRNKNPGANREPDENDYRQRSREKDKPMREQNKISEQVADNSSNYSFLINSSKQALEQINKGINNLNIDEQSASKKSINDLSFEIASQPYKWSGKESNQWSYSNYVKEMEAVEEAERLQQKPKQVEVIIIED